MDGEVMKKIVPKLSMSKHHKKWYKVIKNPTLQQILTHNYTNAIYDDGIRLDKNVSGLHSTIIIDLDGTKDEYRLVVHALRSHNIASLVLPSPSHKKALKEGLYKMRILVRAKGLKKNIYGYQYKQFFIDMGIKLKDHSGIDATAGEISRFFYPPVMYGIKEPMTKVDNKWIVPRPKPRNIDMDFAMDLVLKIQGKPYKAKTFFSPEARIKLVPPPETPKKYKGKTGDGKKFIITLPRDRVVNTTAYGKMKLSDIVELGVHVRCDCPFDECTEHNDKVGRDYAFCNSSGFFLCGNASLSGTGRHAHLQGEVNPFKNEVKLWKK